MKDRPDEQFLMEVVEETRPFEVFLKDDPYKYFQEDIECHHLTHRYIKNLIETYNRVLAAVCSDHKKSADSYKELIYKYNKTFEDFLKLNHKTQTKVEE